MIVFDNPIAYVLLNGRSNDYCGQCFVKLKQPYILCTTCNFAQYCDAECQKKALIGNHGKECTRLLDSFPNLPTSEVLFMARLLDNLTYVDINGDTEGWMKHRRFNELMGHNDHIKTTFKLDHFKKVYQKTIKFLGKDGQSLTVDSFWDMFCKVAVNSFTIKTPLGLELGISLDLGVSRYDHSCKPNCIILFDGINAILRPLVPEVDVHNVNTAFISYIDVARSKYKRRQDLLRRWYFNCSCTRCQSDETECTSILCDSCDDGCIYIEEETPLPLVKPCTKCKTVPCSEYIKDTQLFMINLPNHFNPSNHDRETIEEKLKKAEKLLSESNVYLTRMRLLSLHLMSALEQTTMNPKTMKNMCDKFERFLPPNDPRLSCQLLHVIRNYCLTQQYSNALPLALRAKQIFKICFGEDGCFTTQLHKLVNALQSSSPDNNKILSLIDLNAIL